MRAFLGTSVLASLALILLAAAYSYLPASEPPAKKDVSTFSSGPPGPTASEIEKRMLVERASATGAPVVPAGAPVPGMKSDTPAPAGTATCAYVPLTSGVTATCSSATNFVYSQSVPFWSAVGVRSASGNDWDIQLYRDTETEFCVSNLVASSTYGAGVVDFVVGDYNHDPLDPDFAYVFPYSATQPATVEWDDGPEALTVNGHFVTRGTGAKDVLETWDVWLDAGMDYTFTLAKSAGVSASLFVFRNPAASPYWAGRGSAAASTSSTMTYTAPASDWYGVVVVNETGVAGTYSVMVGACTPPVALTSGTSTTTSNAVAYYSFSQTAQYWTAVATRASPDYSAADWDIDVWTDDVGSAWPVCFSVPLISSNQSGSLTDFILGDFNHIPTGTYFCRPYFVTGSTSAARTDWDDGSDALSVGGAPTVSSTSEADLIQVWDVYLESGKGYDFYFSRSGSADTKLLLFKSLSGAYWQKRSMAMFTTTSTHTQADIDETDWYAVVVVNDNGGTGNYTVGVSEVAPDYVPFLPDTTSFSGSFTGQVAHFFSHDNCLENTAGNLADEVSFLGSYVQTSLLGHMIQRLHDGWTAVAGTIPPEDHILGAAAGWSYPSNLSVNFAVMDTTGTTCVLYSSGTSFSDVLPVFPDSDPQDTTCVQQVNLFIQFESGSAKTGSAGATGMTAESLTDPNERPFGTTIIDIFDCGEKRKAACFPNAILFSIANTGTGGAVSYRMTSNRGAHLTDVSPAIDSGGSFLLAQWQALRAAVQSNTALILGAGLQAATEGPSKMMTPCGGNNGGLQVFVHDEGATCSGSNASCAIFASGTTLGLPSSIDVPEEDGTPRPVLSQNAPNPFRPSTTIRFEVSRADRPTVLRVYDTSGRLVRTLVNAALAAGSHEAIWDGRDEKGRPLPAGVYMYALEGERRAAKTMVLLR